MMSIVLTCVCVCKSHHLLFMLSCVLTSVSTDMIIFVVLCFNHCLHRYHGLLLFLVFPVELGEEGMYACCTKKHLMYMYRVIMNFVL